MERAGREVPASAWLRRGAAKTLVKLLATRPEHRLHREEILEILWPEADPDSALNRFGKALHAARRALEPTLPIRSPSSYLTVENDLLSLNTEHVWIDADHFQMLAARALASLDVAAFEKALAAYRAELLPEDRYEDWAATPREALAGLRLRLLQAYARVLEQRGDYDRAAGLLRQVLELDPLQEEVHRNLMRLYASSGSRHQALRQYHACREVLRAELDADPEPETDALHDDILKGKLAPRAHAGEAAIHAEAAPLPAVLRRMPDTPIVGRDRVRDVLREQFALAEAGAGQVALISGEAGVGKSRLALDLAREATERGAVVLWGTSYRHQHFTPYGPFIQALESYIVDRPAAEREELTASYPLLAYLLPSLAPNSPGPGAGLSPEVVHGRLLAAFAAMLGRLSATRALLLVLDDLHAADATSLHLLLHLGHAASAHRWLIVGTYRDEDVSPGSEIHRVLTSFTRGGPARHISLLRLSREDTNRFVEALLQLETGTPTHRSASSTLLDRVYALSLGNPLFVHELVRSMQDEGALELVHGRWQLSAAVGNSVVRRVPGEVHDLVAARVSHLSTDVRRILSLAAVAGMQWSFADLFDAAMLAFPSSLDEETLMEALDRALSAQILEDRGEVYSFQHPLVHAALLQQTPSHRRAQFHAAIAVAIERQRPDDVEVLAHHYALSRNQEKAITYLERAGDRARAIHANKTAESYYRELLSRVQRCLDHHPDDTRTAAVHMKLGSVLTILAHYDEALEQLDRAARIYERAGDVEALGRATARLGRAHAYRGSWQEGLRRVQQVLATLGETGLPPAEGMRALYAALAWLLLIAARHSDALAAATRAAQLAREARDNVILVRGEVSRGVALLHLARYDEAHEALEGAVAIAEVANELDMMIRALNNLAALHMLGGAFDRSRLCLEVAVQAAGRLGDPERLAFMTYRLGVNAFFAGCSSEASQHFEQAISIGSAVETYWAAPYPLFALALTYALEGRMPEAVRSMSESVSVARRLGEDPHGIRLLRGPYSLLSEFVRLGRDDKMRSRLVDLLRQAGLEQADVESLLSGDI